MKKFKFSFRLEAMIAVLIVIFIPIALFVPDDSIFKHIFGYFVVAVIVLMFIWPTKLANPIKRWLARKGWL